MTDNQITKFMSAVEAAGIKTYAFVDDITAYYRNGESGICKYDSANKAIIAININSSGTARLSNPLRLMMADIVDIHRAEIQGPIEAIKKFIDEYGLSLNNKELEVLYTIDRSNNIVKPVTGDYTHTYHKLSQEEYDALDPEEKAKYDATVKADQARLVGLPKGRAGMVIDGSFPMLDRNEYLK